MRREGWRNGDPVNCVTLEFFGFKGLYFFLPFYITNNQCSTQNNFPKKKKGITSPANLFLTVRIQTFLAPCYLSVCTTYIIPHLQFFVPPLSIHYQTNFSELGLEKWYLQKLQKSNFFSKMAFLFLYFLISPIKWFMLYLPLNFPLKITLQIEIKRIDNLFCFFFSLSFFFL